MTAPSDKDCRLPEAVYVWLVPTTPDHPNSWRIRKWDTDPFPEATHTVSSRSAIAPSRGEITDEEFSERLEACIQTLLRLKNAAK